MRLGIFVTAMLILIGGEILKVYYIMPFGSQEQQSLDWAYFIHRHIWWFRIAGCALAVYPAIVFIRSETVWVRWPVIVTVAFWPYAAYVLNFRFLAEKIFYQPGVKVLLKGSENKIPMDNLVIGVSINGESKAYPIEIIGYHHQVRDTVGGVKVMVTYCTVCRTGRVFSPLINGQDEQFRLVGMDHFNAMFEDSRTESWWRQVNGEAVTGPMKGQRLSEIESEQMSLGSWLEYHPETYVMQPDSNFLEAYDGLRDYDEGLIKDDLVRRDSLSWQDKSWVVGVQIAMEARAYDWIELVEKKVINDNWEASNLVVAVERDSATFHVWRKPDTLSFTRNDSLNMMVDTNTWSLWNWAGECVSGRLSGNKLAWQQSYQEYWHSWRTFRPQTTRYGEERH